MRHLCGMCLWQDIWSCLGPSSFILQSQSQASQTPMILLSKERGQSHHRMHPWKAASKHLTGKWVKEEETGPERDNLKSNTHAPQRNTHAPRARAHSQFSPALKSPAGFLETTGYPKAHHRLSAGIQTPNCF